MVTALERKQQIYQICSEHDIVILEDDPCDYLQYSLGAGQQHTFLAPLYCIRRTRITSKTARTDHCLVAVHQRDCNCAHKVVSHCRQP